MEDCTENGKWQCHFKTKDKTSFLWMISERISLGILLIIKEQKLGYTFSDFFRSLAEVNYLVGTSNLTQLFNHCGPAVTTH